MNSYKLIQIGILASAIFLSGCASIVSKSKWPVSFKSDPSGAEVTILDENGKKIHRGTTPATIILSSGSGYFSPENYLVDIKLNGYQQDKGVIKANMNGWYFGNIVFGGLIGLLIVDPMTGAMWKLPSEYTVNLSKLETQNTAALITPQPKPDVMTTNSAPAVTDNKTNSVSQK